MQEQVDRAGLPAPRAIGVDEISIRKGHNYRVIVSDLERVRPIYRDEEYLKLKIVAAFLFRHYPEMQFSTHTNPRRPE